MQRITSYNGRVLTQIVCNYRLFLDGAALTLGLGQMCILEQFLPDGPQHPFAEKMIKHFNNLKTPLQSLSTYPSLSDQVRRFEKLGWSSVHATSLWDLWTNTTCIYESERAHLDSVEPFDEWEEFILFASHYFILYAQHDKGPADILPEATDPRVSKAAEHDERPHLRLQYLEPVEPRRFGSCFRTLSGFAYFGGIGERTRTNTTNTFSLKPLCTTPTAYQNAKFDAEAIVPALTSARSCQASATSWNGNTLITGGRESPEKPLCESIYYNGKWHRKSDMPQARFRHCMSWVYHDASSNEEVGVLVFGGKTNDNVILSSWSLWRESSGWHEVSSRGSTVQPLFGASMVNLQHNQGLSLGGLDRNGLIQSTTFYWTFESQNGHLVVHISELNYTNPSQKLMVARVGSRAIPTKYGPLVIGGTSNKVLDANHEIVRLRPPKQFEDGWSTEAIGLQQFYNDATSRQLLVGHSVLHVQGNILIMGGGAVCFSFGTFWSQRPLLLSMTDEACDDAQHSLIKVGPQSIDDENAASRGTTAQHAQHGFGFKQRFTKSMGTSLERPKTLLLLQRVRLQNPEDFQRIALRKTPVIIEGLELGSCVAEWTLDGLVRKIGQDREVTTHTSKDRNMNFVEKNFSYTRKAFGSFVEEITNGSRQYLRSLATDHPSQKPANIANDFPGLAGDFRLPLPLDEVGQRTHSSVLRISGPVEMWLHYDVMANLLCQIVGQKRAVLYPPSDIPYLEVPAGASSSPLAVFDPETLSIHPALRLAHPHEAMLRPGDVLYIPPLWFHAMSPIDDVSVAVNVFFRDLATGYAPGRDIYGNRDLQAYETGRSTVAKMCKSFATLPDQMAGFYLARLSDELKEESVRRFSLSSKLETLTPSSESNGQA